jgi:tetrahydromethanopterin S-methyltransferase subunit F
MNMDDNKDSRSASENAEIRKREALIRDKEELIRQEGMKKGVMITAIIGFVLVLITGIIGYSLYNRNQKMLLGQMDTQQNSYTNQLTSRDSVINTWVNSFVDIEKNIALIKEKEHIITMNSSKTELSNDKRVQIVEDIKYINTLLEQNKQKIAALNSQLGKSGGTIKVLQGKIAELEASVKQSESDIAEMKTTLSTKNFEIEQLNTKNSDLNVAIVQKDEKIDAQTFEMNKAFFACGTYKQLKAKGLLTKEGGFIGLGKTKSLTSGFSDNAFEQIDLTVTKSIRVNSKNAKLISEHPANSYQFIRDKDKKIESIEITDPALFWKISKYAVVELI